MEYLVLEEVFSCAKPSVSPAAIFFLDGDSASWSYGCLRYIRDPSHHHPPPIYPFQYMQPHNPWVLFPNIPYFGAFKPYRYRLHE